MAQPSGDDRYHPRLGQLSLVCLVVANMLGVGVFTTRGFAGWRAASVGKSSGLSQDQSP